MDQLPAELLQLIADHLDVPDLRAWIATAKRYYHSPLPEKLYSRAVRSDESRFGHPVYLIIAAFLNQTTAFKHLLDRTPDITSPLIKLDSVPINFDVGERYRGQARLGEPWEPKNTFRWNRYAADWSDVQTSLLHVLCALGRVDLVRLAVEAGAAINVYDSRGWTPLHSAIGPREEDVAITKLLVDAGVDLDYPIRSRVSKIKTALHFAINGKCTAIVEMLVDAGADLRAKMGGGPPWCMGSLFGPPAPSYPDPHGTRLLSLAATCGDGRIVKAIMNGIDFSKVDLTLALHNAMEHDQNVSAIQALLDGGAELRRHMLTKAVKSDNLPVVQLLIDAGAVPIPSN